MFRRIATNRRRPVSIVLAVTAFVVGAWTTTTSRAGALQATRHVVTGYEIVTATTEMSTYDIQSTSARCSRGKRVLGGGASILGSSGAAVFWNGPARTTATGSWAAAAQEVTSTAGPWSLEVYAICAYAVRSG